MIIKTNDEDISKILKNTYNDVSNEIMLTATLDMIYLDKKSEEIINTKVNNQVNSIEISINKINPKFNEKSKKYSQMNDNIVEVVTEFENVLKQLCNNYDKKIEDLILKKVEMESKLLMAVISKNYLYKNIDDDENKKNIVKDVVKKIKKKVSKKEKASKKQIQETQVDVRSESKQSEEYQENRKYIINLEKEIRNLNKEIKKLDDEKEEKVFQAMEVGERFLSTEIRKPRTFKKITKFFTNRFNTYNVIVKNIIDPLKHRVDEFKVNELGAVDKRIEEFNFDTIKEKIDQKQKNILNDVENKLICKKLGIFD